MIDYVGLIFVTHGFFHMWTRSYRVLPKNLREEILNNEGFHIISEAVLSDFCGQCLYFHQPIEFLIYLNPALEMQPDIRISCSIATELANYVAIKERWSGDEGAHSKAINSMGF